MYIVLKGLVNVEIFDEKYKIKKTVTQKKDGEVFGELAMVNINAGGGIAPPQRLKRTATCITVEESFMLRLEQSRV